MNYFNFDDDIEIQLFPIQKKLLGLMELRERKGGGLYWFDPSPWRKNAETVRKIKIAANEVADRMTGK